MLWPGMVRLGWVGRGAAMYGRRGTVGFGQVRRVRVWSGRLWYGRQGGNWLGGLWFGKVRQGLAGKAVRGRLCHGMARLGNKQKGGK